jgi:hypothetical protein
MTFDIALCKLREGNRIRRKHWNETCYLRLVPADEITRTKARGHAFNERRPIVLSTSGKTRAWIPSQSEILANDWVVL